MSYFNCRRGDPHEDCNGYIGPLDTYVCPCLCHTSQESTDAEAVPDAR